VILDACRDNPFAHSFRSASRGLAIITNASVGTFISYSTGAGEVAQDGDGRNSPYAAALMEFIGEPGLAIEQIFKKVRQKLSKQTHGKQIPWELSSLQGDFFFNPVSSEANRSLLAEEKKVVLAEIVPPAKAIERSVKNLPPKFRDPATGMEFVLVKGGCFKMGDNFGDGLSGEKPVHEVCLDDYYIGKYEVTQKQWQKIMGSNISHFKKCGMDCPAESMSWIDANTFIAELNKTANQKYRLPTEAEWEYAARGAGKIEKFAGTSSADKLGDYAWQESNSYDQVHPAGKKKPNSLGLYDMTGNVWEWCLDWYDDGYYASSPKDNPTGPATGTNRLVRGCSWFDRANDCRASLRYSFSPKDSFKSIGFRLVKPQ
jgi:formylglycine-generating enzyme required for sulfatase activity